MRKLYKTMAYNQLQLNYDPEEAIFFPPIADRIRERYPGRVSATSLILSLLKDHQEISKLGCEVYTPSLYDEANDIYVELKRSDVIEGRAQLQISSYDTVAICSKVTTNSGETRFIPMMDFEISPSDRNLQILIDAIRSYRKELPDIGEIRIICSGNSYHLLGSNLLTEEEQLTFLSRFHLLFSELVDKKYINQALETGNSALRISSDPHNGHQFPPYLVYVIY